MSMSMDPKHNSKSSSSSKISDIVRLQRILKKWKNIAKNAPKSTTSTTRTTTTTTAAITSSATATGTAAAAAGGGSSKGIKFLKRTLSFTDLSSSAASSSDVVPKGSLAVCVGKELKRFVIPTEYLRHQAFGVLLQEAEEEFGFQQEGVLKIPCQVSVFEKILKAVEEKKDVLFLSDHQHQMDGIGIGWCSPDSHHPQLCR